MEEVKQNPVVRVETRVSKKTGNPFVCLVVAYKGYEKLVFLDDAEKFIFSNLIK